MKLGAALCAATLLVIAPAMAETSVNSQFAASSAQTLTIENTGARSRTVYARFQFLSDPDNRNYGFVQTIRPGDAITYQLPAGTRVFACDGRYWDAYRPREREVAVLDEGAQIRFEARQFRP